MLNCLRTNLKSYLFLLLLCVFGLVVLNLSQNHSVFQRGKECKPCNCDTTQLQSYIQDRSGYDSSTEAMVNEQHKSPCNCHDDSTKAPLLTDLMKQSSPMPKEFEISEPVCPRCLQNYSSINVNVDNKKSLTGLYSLKDGSIFIPLNFLQKRYEISTNVQMPSKYQKGSVLWLSANATESDVSDYSPHGQYMNMVNRSVEGRERVKCISALEGVPVTTQWSKLGYFYPTQIAQFGLSHFCKLLKYPKPVVFTIENGSLSNVQNWKIHEGASIRSVFDKGRRSQVVFFDSRGIQEDGISYHLTMDPGNALVLSFSVRLRNSGQISVKVLASDRREYFIRYAIGESMWVKYSYPDIYYGLARRGKWLHLTRDLNVDLQKGLGSNPGRKVKLVEMQVVQVIEMTFQGTGWLDNITLSTSAHERLFLTAANWLVKNQDSEGGWAINVTRKVVKGVSIKPGWYSAMSQGQAISLLCRAFKYTRNHRYLNAAFAALKLFRKPSSERGIVAYFMDKYKWYEEYPTQPPLFVLNGFMYSLIGLYDLSVYGKTTKWGDEARLLLDEGLNSLEAMLPLYDTGSGTLYDLRHITLPESWRPPNRARWTYHVLHIEQLKVIRQFYSSAKIDKLVKRWRKYLFGYISPHN